MAEEAPKAAPSAPTATTPAVPDGSQQPPVAAAAPEGSEAISSEDAASQIDKIDDWDQLENILKGRPPSQVKAKAGSESSTSAPAPAQAAAAPAPAASAAPAASEPGGDDEVFEAAGEKLPKNFRFHTEDPQRSRYLRLLRQRPEANPIDLAIEAGYTAAQARAAAAAPAAPAAPVQPDAHPDVVRLKAEIADLTKKKTEAKGSYEFGKVDEYAEQIFDKKLELQRLSDQLEAESAFDAEYRGDYTSAREEAVLKYPDTNKPGTAQFEEVQREVSFLERNEPGFFDDPGFPLALLERLEKRRPDLFKGTTAAASAAAPAPAAAPIVSPPPNAAPKNAARPVGVVAAGTEGASQPLGKEETVKAIEDMSLEELEKLGDKIGTVPKSANRGRVPGIIRSR